MKVEKRKLWINCILKFEERELMECDGLGKQAPTVVLEYRGGAWIVMYQRNVGKRWESERGEVRGSRGKVGDGEAAVAASFSP